MNSNINRKQKSKLSLRRKCKRSMAKEEFKRQLQDQGELYQQLDLLFELILVTDQSELNLKGKTHQYHHTQTFQLQKTNLGLKLHLKAKEANLPSKRNEKDCLVPSLRSRVISHKVRCLNMLINKTV